MSRNPACSPCCEPTPPPPVECLPCQDLEATFTMELVIPDGATINNPGPVEAGGTYIFSNFTHDVATNACISEAVAGDNVTLRAKYVEVEGDGLTLFIQVDTGGGVFGNIFFNNPNLQPEPVPKCSGEYQLFPITNNGFAHATVTL